MKIVDYRKKHSVSQRAFADLIDVSQSAVAQFEDEGSDVSPSGKTAARIVKKTNGEVGFADLYPEPKAA